MYNFIELCSGAGGLSTGLIKSGVINAKKESYSKKHIINNNEILELHQNSFFNLVFGINTNDILNFLHNFTEKYNIFKMHN